MGGGGVELRTHLKPQSREERRQRRAASPPLPPFWERSLGLRRRGSPAGAEGGEGGPASRERHPGRGSHLGPERFSRQRRGRGGVRPVPRPTEAVHTSAPEPERRGEAAPHAPAPAQRHGGRASSPLRAAPRGTAGGRRGGCSPEVAAVGLRPAEPPHLRGGRGGPRAAPEEGGVPGEVTRSIPAWGGGGGDSEPGARPRLPGTPCSGGASPLRPGAAPGPPRAPLPRTAPARRGRCRPGRGCSPAARSSRSRQTRGNLSTIRSHAGNYIPGIRSDRCKDKGAASTFRLE